MTAARAAIACLALAGCVAAPAGPDPAAQAAACAGAVAAHVGLPRQAVTTAPRAPADGVAAIEARDGDRLHVCAVDAAGRVLRIDHPRDPSAG